MANSNSTSSKFLSMNRINTKKSDTTSLNQKEYFSHSVFEKENIEINKNRPEAAKISQLLDLEKHRDRKTSDSVIYESKKRNVSVLNKVRNLISNWETKENVPPKRHFSEIGESYTSSLATADEKEFQKSGFKIYTSAEETQKQVKASCSKNQKCEIKRAKKADDACNIVLNKKLKLLKSRPEENQFKNYKLLNLRVQELLHDNNKETPVDALPIPINQKKIKLEHKKSSLEEKYQLIPKDTLPDKLLFNVEYMEDFLELQLLLEQSHQLSSDFLKKGINRHQRKLIVSFLIKVTTYCKYPSFILYQTIRILDKMLDLEYIDIDELQLLGLTSLWITLKRIHTMADIPNAEDILYFSKGEYTEHNLFKCELNILRTLKCEISFIDPFSILAYFFINNNNPFLQLRRTDMMYYCASYLIDVSLLSSTICRGSTIVLIVAAAELALFVILAKEIDFKNPDWLFWRRGLPTIYKDGRGLNSTEIEITRRNLIKLALLSKETSNDYYAVFQKYKRPRYGCISEIMIGRLQKISQSDYN